MTKETIVLTLVAGGNLFILVIFRSIALSRHSKKLHEILVWRADVLTRYGWVFAGAALLVLFLYKSMAMAQWLYFLALWIVGARVLWALPPWLAKKI